MIVKMDTRKRSFHSVPLPKRQEYATKRELSERKSFPVCPTLPSKINRRSTFKKFLFPEKSTPTAIYFTKPVKLSEMYNSTKEQSYTDQVFAKSDLIGEGSFGLVFKAKSREDNNIYAIKQFKESHNLHYAYAEVKNYEKVGDHNNFVKFFMAWEENKIVYILMECCQSSLAQYADLMKNISEAQLWEILHDILQALNYLHEKNFIHLDVKPGNIMITSNGYYKLADFGLLVDLNQHNGSKISTVSDGDAKYLAREVLDGVYTYSCDIFGLGISLLEVATNIELPEFGILWHQIRQTQLPDDFYRVVNRQFSAIIEKMMSFAYLHRPKASKILKFAALRKVQNRDKKVPRKNIVIDLMDQDVMQQDGVIGNSNVCNNKVMGVARWPLRDVRSSLNYGSDNARELLTDNTRPSDNLVQDSQEKISLGITTSRRGCPRVKLF